MAYIFLIFAVICNATSSVIGKAYNLKNEGLKGSSAVYNLFQAISVFAVWVIIFLTDISFDLKVLPYSLAFAFFFTMVLIGLINALKTGPVALTSLMISLSLILTTIWGFIFWNDKITPVVIIGLVLVVISIVLCLYSRSTDEKKISLKWVFFVLIAFISNAGCTIVQRSQQIAFGGAHGGMLMLFATFFSAVACLVIFLVSDKTGGRTALKCGWYFPVGAGVGNALLNLFVILLATSALSPSLIYPVIGVGSLAIATLSSLLFKEKLKLQQIIGIVIGAVATVLLSI